MDFDFNRLLADAVRVLAQQPSVTTTLERVVARCTDEVGPCDLAGISVVDAGQLRTMAGSDARLCAIDRLQLELREGPCYDPRHHEETVASNDLAREPRWPVWGPRIVGETGMCSIVSYRLFATRDSCGALNLYAARPEGFDQEALLRGQTLAAHASVALATGFKESQLTRALESRTVIGQATGILMERFGLDADQAFAVMRRVSQNHNVKLQALAQHLVETGVLLEPRAQGEQSAPKDEDGQTSIGT